MKKQFHIILITVMVLSFIGHLILYPGLPDTIPTHWGFDGTVDGYGPKYMDLVLAALPLFIYVVLLIVPRIDPRSASYAKHRPAYQAFVTAITLFLIILSWGSVLAVKGFAIDISQVTIIAIGILMLLMGNYLPQIRSNYTFGIKTPWTIENEWVWRKTHQAGGIVFCVIGIVMIAAAFLRFLMVPSFILVMAGSVWLYIYSWLLYKKVKNSGDDSQSRED